MFKGMDPVGGWAAIMVTPGFPGQRILVVLAPRLFLSLWAAMRVYMHVYVYVYAWVTAVSCSAAISFVVLTFANASRISGMRSADLRRFLHAEHHALD